MSVGFRRVHFSLRQRVALFCGLSVLLDVGLVWSAVTVWRESAHCPHCFTTTQFAESFRIAGQLQSSVLGLNASLLASGMSGAEEDWARAFNGTAWISTAGSIFNATPSSRTSEERAALEAINREYDRYLAVARSLRGKDPGPPTPETVHQLAAATGGDVSALGSQLAEAHRRALGDLLRASQRSLGLLQGPALGRLFRPPRHRGVGCARSLFLENDRALAHAS